ncbi:MAG: hypothetical protein LQ340_006419 [Diploschistes diacapsis]|nr:MAG: hypothetical protein LQ340_006419 [Diploschistes diacapsis]
MSLMKQTRFFSSCSWRSFNTTKSWQISVPPLCASSLRTRASIRFSSTQQYVVIDESGRQFRVNQVGDGFYNAEPISHTGLDTVQQSHKAQEVKPSRWRRIWPYALGILIGCFVGLYPQLKKVYLTTHRLVGFLNDTAPVGDGMNLLEPGTFLNLIRELAPIWASWFPEHEPYTSAFLRDFVILQQKYSSKADWIFVKANTERIKIALEKGPSDEAARRAGNLWEKYIWEIYDIAEDIFSDVLNNHPELRVEPDWLTKGLRRHLIARALRSRHYFEKQWPEFCETVNDSMLTSIKNGVQDGPLKDELFSLGGELLCLLAKSTIIAGNISVLEKPSLEPDALPTGDRILMKLMTLSQVEHTNSDKAKESFRRVAAEIEELLDRKLGELDSLEKEVSE